MTLALTPGASQRRAARTRAGRRRWRASFAEASSQEQRQCEKQNAGSPPAGEAGAESFSPVLSQPPRW
jgi:hypothetical protein